MSSSGRRSTGRAEAPSCGSETLGPSAIAAQIVGGPPVLPRDGGAQRAPVARSQASTVSPWLAKPDRVDAAARPLRSPRSRRHAPNPTAARGPAPRHRPATARGVTAASTEATISPSSPKTTALVAEVPWSMARTLTACRRAWLAPLLAARCGDSRLRRSSCQRERCFGRTLAANYSRHGATRIAIVPATPAAVLVGGSPDKGGWTCQKVSEEAGSVGLATLDGDEQAAGRVGLQAGAEPLLVRVSRTSPSASPSSPSSPVVSRRSMSGWNGGGPAAIAWGWPVLAALVLCIGLCLSELVSAFPTSGGIYWWASKLGGVKSGYYTGWLNLIGLLAIVASVAYGCATFFDLTLGFLFPGSYTSGNLDTIFLYFMGILVHRRPGQHLLEPPAGDLQQHLGVVARDRRGGHRPDPDLPAPPPRQRQNGLHLHRQQHRVLRRARQTGRASSSSFCPSAPC